MRGPSATAARRRSVKQSSDPIRRSRPSPSRPSACAPTTSSAWTRAWTAPAPAAGGISGWSPKGPSSSAPPDRARLAFRANWRYTFSQIGSVAMISTARLVETLGGKRIIKGRPLSDEAVIDRVRSGLPFTALEAIATHFEIPQERLVRVLALPLRTLARRKKERRLRADESDRLIRLALIATLAQEILLSP